MNRILIICCSLLIAACNQEHQHAQPVAIEKFSKGDSLLKKQLPDTISKENHSVIMDAILGKPKHSIKTIGILVYDGANDLDVMGPRYVLGQAGAKVQLIAINPGNIKTVMGVEIVPDNIIDSVKHLDILVIPGGATGTIQAAYNSHLHDWIRSIDRGTTYTASVCTGAWVLGATGLLNGKKATTNWYRAEEMLKKYGATFTHERFTHDGKYWTSAGVTAGMDMALAIINDNWGERYTQGVMLDMEYDPAPPISGGTPEKTGFLVEWMMKAMYDAGINPLIDSLDQVKAAKHEVLNK